MSLRSLSGCPINYKPPLLFWQQPSFRYHPGYVPSIWRSLPVRWCCGPGAPLSHSPCIYVQQRVSQEGQIKWTRPMETQACLWCKSPARMFIALIGEKLWLFQTTDDLGSRYSLYFCVHPNRPDIHSFISCCNHSLALSEPFTGVCFFFLSPAVRMDTRVSFPTHRLLVLLCTAAALLGTRSPLAAAGRSCSDTRQVYLEKGYSTSTAPLTQISGKTVPIPQSGNKLKQSSRDPHRAVCNDIYREGLIVNFRVGCSYVAAEM